jgi:hypothetical protein
MTKPKKTLDKYQVPVMRRTWTAEQRAKRSEATSEYWRKTSKAIAEHRRKISEASTTHGGSRTPEYRSWCHMKGRCDDMNDKDYASYGARGIKVCKRWRHSFENFLTDMGPRPGPGYSIERIDNDGDYEPGNCYWATPEEQARNKRNNRVLTYDGKSLTVTEWSEVTGIGNSLIRSRIDDLGWSVDKALSVPANGAYPDRRGERHAMHVLTEAEVLEIRSLPHRPKGHGRCQCHRDYPTHTSIAAEYAVTREAVSDVLNRRTWKHV